MKELEKRFSDFIDSEKGEEIFNLIFSAIRKVYIQGYQDSKDATPKSPPVIDLFDPGRLGEETEQDP